MSKLTLSDLPEVFVSFETVKANRGKVIYYNKDLGVTLSASELMSRYNYITIDTALESDNFLDRKVFFAERYGGDGISTNGGGGRCGFDGVFQLKGLGPNQLVGDRPRDTYGNSHANGLLSLDVAIYEAIWAEVINIALPYGAVRTVAVIDLEYDFEEPDKKHARGLLVRLPAVRPAHFIRAVYFKEMKIGSLSEDAKRVKKAVKKLVDFLPKNNHEVEFQDLNVRITLGMVELVTRYAKQFAAARAKRIFHQSISASNITLEGGWMDLAGASVFSDKIWWEGFDVKQYLTEYEPAIGSVRDMCFYLCKYQVMKVEESNELAELAITVFNLEYNKSLSLYNAAQAGFPLEILGALSDDMCFLRYSDFIYKVLRDDRHTVAPITARGGWTGYEHWIAKLYKQLLRQKIYQTKESFCWFSKDQEFLRGLIYAYDALFDLVLRNFEGVGGTYSGLCKLVSINVTRLNRCGSVLFSLQSEIPKARKAAELEDGKFGVDKLFQEAIDSACLAYKHYAGVRTLFWKSGAEMIFYDASNDCFVTSVAGREVVMTGTFSEISAAVSLVRSAAPFYDDVIEVFYE
ncbi:hypothetical protein HBO18_17995 [Pseudomonas lactis]|uniref:MchC protein n=1 Tax=Pseudomonas lactis TaxID=1615674 RepID=A0A7Y1LH45_9PSED|nr:MULTISPECIES: hypothetical protein [Pseudomonas]MDI3249633.1 hypothetical protein [Pseudomonas sp. AL10]MDI3267712.1 hypothetical protein [Pseudomonas sp. AL15]NNA46021.1 hypothetical protein [Pseudomonas lactis]